MVIKMLASTCTSQKSKGLCLHTLTRPSSAASSPVALHFDNPIFEPDAAYAYVGASRVRRAQDLFHIGRIRTSDWTPNGVAILIA